MERYDILTLNAKSLMWFSKRNGNHPEYKIDLSSTKDSRNFSVISSTEEMGDSPFFYQILQCSKKRPSEYSFDRSKLIYEDVIFVDFKDSLLFLNRKKIIADIKKLNAKTAKLKNKKIKAKAKSLIRSENIRGFSIGKHLSTMLNNKYGIYITFKDGNEVHFVPSDRSSSMAKASKLAFINAKYLDEMGKRLCLNMDFKHIGVKDGGIQLSKYYAYRGLYLTTSERIHFDKKNIINKTSFIVLKDFKDVPIDGNGKTFFTAKKQEHSSQHDFFTTTEYNDLLNIYDGEGLICPDLTDQINYSLWLTRDDDQETFEKRLKDYKTLTSIQIRGPFLKGMLHTVDFESFFKKYGNIIDGKLMIKDAFGIERNLLAAKIIVNESMFKCAKWLKEYCEWSKHTDPMEVYFQAFKQYDHGLYVANAVNDIDEDEFDEDYKTENTNESQNEVGIETLNYQFLSTLNITNKDLEALVSSHFDIALKTIKNKYSYGYRSKPYNITDLPVYLRAAKKNPEFLCTNKVKTGLQQELKNYRLLCGRGKLKTYGEHRYLSSDLLAYMIDILSQTSSPQNIQFKTLDEHTFYAPAKKNTKEYNGEIAFERNPHLSRQEEVVLKALTPKKDSLYNQFGLDKLSDIVMFPRASLNFMILSSADTDGDMIMMYSSSIIVDAIKRGCYNKNLDRTLPIIIIPDEGKTLSMATEEGNPDIELLIETFSNKVGKISNMAVTFARDEYSDHPKSLIQNLTAKCTILTGLEIDKIKHGFSVAQDIGKLEKECIALKGRKRKDYFIERKEKLSSPFANKCTVTKAKNEKGFVLSSNDNDYLSVGIEPLNSVSFPLDRILSYYGQYESASSIKDDKIFKELLSVNKDNAHYYFKFQENNNWQKQLDKTINTEIKNLITAYKQALKSYNNIHNSLEINDATNFHGKALYYLQKRYDGSDYSFKPSYSDKTVEELLIESETFVENQLNDYDKARDALNNLVETYKWPFITEKKEREKVLKSILGSKIPKDIVKFMIDFRDEGYFLTYYIFKFVYYRLRSQRAIEEMISHKTINTLKNNRDWGNLFIILKDAIENKYPRTKFLSAIKHYCRMQIDKFFPESDDPCNDALPYIVALSGKNLNDASFFWEVLPSNVILDNIYEISSEVKSC